MEPTWSNMTVNYQATQPLQVHETGNTAALQIYVTTELAMSTLHRRWPDSEILR